MDHHPEVLGDLCDIKSSISLRQALKSSRNDLNDLIRRRIVNQVRRSRPARTYLFGILREVLGSKLISLDYEVNVRPRYTPDNPHPLLFTLINAHRKQYQKTLLSFLQFRDRFVKITLDAALGIADTPKWKNDFLPGLDAVTLYSAWWQQ